MTRMMKEVFMAFFCAIFAYMLMTPVSGKETFTMKNHLVTQEMRSEAKAAKIEEAEKIHTYYINVGGHTTHLCGDYTDYPSYSFNTETGEWSDGGDYVVSDTSYLCKVNRYGELTRVGIILAIEYGDRLEANYMY